MIAVLLLLFAWSQAATLTVVHTNDIHGGIAKRVSKEGREYGGAAALAAFYKTIPEPKLLVDAGDWFQGTPEGGLDDGMAVMDVFNVLPYDALVPGNHDFDLGRENLERLAKASKAPVLSANVYRKRKRLFEPWLVKDVGGVKVGIFGLMTTKLKSLSFSKNIEGVTVRKEIAEAKKAVAALKKAGADVIILVGHVGLRDKDDPPFDDDQAIAREVQGIDLIVGGHSHSYLRDARVDPVHGTLIVQAGANLTLAGRVTLRVDAGRVVSKKAELVDLGAERWGEDPAVAAVVAKKAREAGALFDVVLATAPRALTRDRDRESSLGDWMTDCMRDWAKADVAVQNGGGIRADLPEGPVTRRTIFNIVPFDNRMVTMTMDGEALREALDHGVAPGKGIHQVSGARFTYDRHAPDGGRLSKVEIGDAALRPAADYVVTTVDFVADRGGGRSPYARASKREDTGRLLRDVLADCALKQGTIALPRGGRFSPL